MNRAGPSRNHLLSRACPLFALVLALLATCCTDISQARLARRILESYRARSRAKPLAAAQVVRVRLASPSGGAPGLLTIQWDEGNYRETLASASFVSIRGIQAGKGYFTDEDGVTRLASEPLLSELLTHFYFWKRAFLFADQQRARLSLGASDANTLGVRITPRGGDPLSLTFARSDLSLLRVESRHLRLAFSTPTHFRDSSRGGSPLEGEIAWIGLPTGPLPDTAAGGWSARWSDEPAQASFARVGRNLTLPVRISGQPTVMALDAAEDGPLRVRTALSDRLGLAFTQDVFGRSLARGANLEIGGLSLPSLVVQRSDALPEGIDAAAGSVLLRESVVEIDPSASLVRFYDPTRWASREGFFRVLLDDDGNRAVAILRLKGKSLRLLAPCAIGGLIELTPEATARLGLSGSSEIPGLAWGADLPRLPLAVSREAESDFGEDGRLGWDLVLRFHAFFDMPHRWAYLKPQP